MTKWIELGPSSFSPAAGSLPAPDYWCTPWTVWTPGPDPPKFYLERDQTYNIHVPEGKRATRVDLQFIGYRKKNWKDNLINPYVNGYQTEDNRITDGYVFTSDSGTCAAGWYKFHFSARTNVTLRLEDAKGDARFVATHILLEVEDDGPTTTTRVPTSSPPGTTAVTVTVTTVRPTPTPVPSSSSIPAPTPGTDLPGGGPAVITFTRTGGTLSVSNSNGASDSLSTEVSSTDASAPTAPPGDDAPPSRSRTGLLGLIALGCLVIVASF